ncbi:MAG: RNA polymerase sigma-70 factor [Flavobacteriales bacterium]|nr:RNA polymerase sigma-70 factor [Flavobacteriales bacterium]
MESQDQHFTELTYNDFQSIFSEMFDSIRNYIYFKVADADLAEDIAQDTFVKLWENRTRIDLKTVKSYLYTIANNLTINYMKRQQLQYKFVNSRPLSSEIKDPEYQLEIKEYEQKLMNVISSMPEGCREVFLMNRIEDLKYREIADRLGLSIKAIEKRMSKAIQIIRDELGVDI